MDEWKKLRVRRDNNQKGLLANLKGKLKLKLGSPRTNKEEGEAPASANTNS